MSSGFDGIWYGKSPWTILLRPLAWLFIATMTLRRTAYRLGILKTSALAVPVVVVGNISVGGTGKTPLVIWLANYLKAAGFQPGIISRGYTGQARRWPQQVRPDADPRIVGDEALVIARRTHCPMAVGPNRVACANALLKYATLDIIISDDGLQHYALDRQVEIAVIDGVRRLGNGFCLPAGPLREGKSRLDKVDMVVTNGTALQQEYAMRYGGKTMINLISGETRELDSFKSETVMAIAAIGNPDRFFNFIRAYGVRISTCTFPDHHFYTPNELMFDAKQAVLMTEKDAVKCERFAQPNWWYLPIEVQLPDEFGAKLLTLLEKSHGQKVT
ncbi:MAG: tetraacyldisaccharide 4'-kinase [Gammaproteobacteria bacterium]|nr:tetraacyldisaccharide 4'-kinase [Gammaproteobacteria bacterium]